MKGVTGNIKLPEKQALLSRSWYRRQACSQPTTIRKKEISAINFSQNSIIKLLE